MHTIDRAIAALLPQLPKALVWRVARRYIAGESASDALRVTRRLNAEGLRATMDILGEDVRHIEDARAAAANYIALLDELRRSGIDSNVSVKLTQLGLKVHREDCLALADSVVSHAGKIGNFVRIDMEDSSCTSDTLEIYRDLRRRHTNVGVVLQAYLRRTAGDLSGLIADLGELNPNFRLCKGVYVEPESIAFSGKAEIDGNYLVLLEKILRSGIYVGIATHDERLVDAALRLISELKLPSTACEFQMLLGVGEPLRARIRARGIPLRVYIPFGPDWHAYSIRRLRESPRLAGYVFKAMFR